MSTIKFVLVRGDKEIGPFEMPFEEMDYYNMSPQDIEEQLEDEMWDWLYNEDEMWDWLCKEDEMWDWLCNEHEIKIVKE